MAMRLLSDSLLNLADNVCTFPAFFSALPSASRLGLLVSSPAFCLIAPLTRELACCFIFCARFHRDSLLCADASRFPELLLRRRGGGRGRRLSLGGWGRGCGCLRLSFTFVLW